MAIKIITEDEVKEGVDWQKAVAAIEQVLGKVAGGQYISPPRHYVGNDNGRIAFTIGGDKDAGVLGFRVYETFDTDIDHQQFTTVFDAKTGALKGIVLGAYIGAVRTGAIGGAAINALSRPDSRSIGIVGSGLQARTQLMSALAVRDIDTVKVYSRNSANCEAFIIDIMSQNSLPDTFEGNLEVVPSAEAAVADADIVILATKSGEPVIDADWLSPGCHVNAVGPKFQGRHELPRAIADRAALLVSDAPAQLRAYATPHFLADHSAFDQIADLAALVANEKPERNAEDITVFLSTGLAGTEPAIANLFLSES